jgi:hypothetical protein
MIGHLKQKRGSKRGENEQTSRSIVRPTPVFTDVGRIEIRRSILDWRDRQFEQMDKALRADLDEFFLAVDAFLETMSVKDLFRQRAFVKKNIEPGFAAWIESETSNLLERAKEDLVGSFQKHYASYVDENADLQSDDLSRSYIEAVFAASAIGAGIALVPVFSGMAVVSSGGLLGLLGYTSISFPVVAVGIATVGGLLALGGYRGVRIKRRVIERLRKSLRTSISLQVIGPIANGTSVLERLQGLVHESTEKMISEIDQC